MDAAPEGALRAWVEYLRDMGLYDLYRSAAPRHVLPAMTLARLRTGSAVRIGSAARMEVRGEVSLVDKARPFGQSRGQGGEARPESAPLSGRPGLDPRAASPATTARLPEALRTSTLPSVSPPSSSSPPPALQLGSPTPPGGERIYFSPESEGVQTLPPELAAPMPKPQPLESLFAAATPIDPLDRTAALAQLRTEIGDCTRCPLAYAGRHNIVFGDGDANGDLMFVGEGPGADEDATGSPFVGKAGQLLNNMISAMGLTRERVYIANIVKCRPPANRTPEFAEATTCSQFLLRQIDIVRPKVIVALGSTAATYLLGVRQPLSALRGEWFAVRAAKVAVTYHPAFLLRDHRQKAEAWKDLQRVMAELQLAPPTPRKA